MTHEDKQFIVLNILYSNKDKSLLSSDITKGREDIISDNELDIILEYFIEKGVVSFIPAIGADGNELSIFRYRLTSEGIVVIEKNAPKKNAPTNPYPSIFTSHNGFQIFIAFKKEIITEATEYSDYSYIFRKLLADRFIHEMKQQQFIDFLSNEYNVDIGKNYAQFKTIANCETTIKNNAYSRYKDEFQ